MLNSCILEIVAPPPRNNNQKISDSFKSKSSYFPNSGNELHPKDPFISDLYLELDNSLTQLFTNQAHS